MIIYDKNNDVILDIPVDDDSYRYRAIRQGDKVFLHFSLTGHVEIPLYSYIEYQGQRYILWKPENLTKHFSRNIEYSVGFGGWWELLERTRYKSLSDKPHKLKFSLTDTPKTFMELMVDNLNLHDSGWTLGTCIEASGKLLSFSHESCMSVLNKLADEFDTEWEITGKAISLRKVERFKDEPVALSYGRGNGFKSGVGRTNQGDKAPVTILYVQGGDRNIDRLRYGSDTLLLPGSQEMEYQGRRYRTDTDGMYITRADKGLAIYNEDGYDASNIYPSRIGEVTGVETEQGVDPEKNPVTFYNITDTTIPATLDYRDCRLDGNKATVIFQSGRLAGREFDIAQTEKDLTGYDHATRTFKLVSIQEDGMTLPNDRLYPSIGDKYAVFNISLPASYVCDNATRTGASWDMLREAARYMYENEEEAFTFKGDLDGIWAKKHWLEIGGKLVPGGYVSFSDGQFQPEGVKIRITGIKDYINRPYSPEIELSNTPVAGFVSSELGKIDANEVTDEDNHKRSIQFTKRSFRDAKETMGMLADALLTNFTESINPVAVATMQLLVGDESLQFRFVNGRTSPVAVDDGIRYDEGRKVVSIPAGIIQHMTLGIKDISPVHEYRFWDMGAYDSPYLDPDKKYFLYARCGETGQSGAFLMSEKAIGMRQEAGHYHLLVGVLNSEYGGERSFTSLYGYTEVLPGRITTDFLRSSDGKTYFDLANGVIHGNIHLTTGSTGYDSLEDKPDLAKKADVSDLAQKADVSALLDTGIDLDGKIITVTAPTFRIQDNGGSPIAVFTTDDRGLPVLKADNIDVDNLAVKKISGARGTFDSIESTNGKMMLSGTAVAFADDSVGVRANLGNSAIPGSTGVSTSLFIEHDHYSYAGANICALLSARGMRNFDDGLRGNIALALMNGCVSGLRINTRRVDKATTLGWYDNFVIAIGNGNFTVGLPSVDDNRNGHTCIISNRSSEDIFVSGQQYDGNLETVPPSCHVLCVYCDSAKLWDICAIDY